MPLLLDASIILLYFAAILSIGLYMGRRERNLNDFALAGRRVPWWAVMASIIAAEVSAATFLGAPGEGFEKHSIAYAQLVIGVILGRILVGYIFLKPYYLFRVYTVYDYLAIRFGPLSKNYVSALFLVMRTLASGFRVFVPTIVMVLAWQVLIHHGQSVAFNPKSIGLPPYIIAIIAVTLLTCIYTAVGGIKAVIWTDLIQATLMFGSALLAIVTLLYHIGGDSFNLARGFHSLSQAVPEMNTHTGYFFLGWEDRFVDAYKLKHGVQTMTAWQWVRLMLENDYTLISATIASIATNMAVFGTDQDLVQRLLTAETYKKSRRSLIAAACMDLPIASAFAFIGVLLVVFYQQQPQLKPEANSHIFGAYILNVMPPGIRGIVLAGVFATAMGSLSTALNALATSATNDWYIPYFGRGKSDHHYVSAARFFTIFFAMLMIAVASAFAYVTVQNPTVRIIPVALGIAGLFLGPMLGVFLIGLLTKNRGSDLGNLIAITVGLISMIFISGQHIDLLNLLHPVPAGAKPIYKLPDWMPVVSWTWFALSGALIVFSIGLLFPTPLAARSRVTTRLTPYATTPDKPHAHRE